MDNINHHLLQLLLLSFIRGNGNTSIETYFNRPHIDGKSCQLSEQMFLGKCFKSEISCILKCTTILRCSSVFYNKEEASCEGCADRYNESSGLLDRVGTKYYSTSLKAKETTTYDFVETKMTFQEALDHCIADGGYLIQVDSEEENQYIAQNFKEGDTAIWLGLTDEQEEGVFKWVTYESLTGYTNWRSGSVGANRTTQNCGVINPKNNYLWEDRDCFRENVVVCEYDI